LGPVMPPEIMSEIARHMRLEQMSDIVAFRSLCKSARDSLPLLLEHWAMKLVGAFAEAVEEGWDEARYDVRTLIFYVLDRSSVYYNRTDPGNGFIITFHREMAKGVHRAEYRLCLFNLQKLALFERKWLFDDPRCVYRCEQLKPSIAICLSDVFHFDCKKEEVTAMKHFPNLRTVEMDVGRRKIKANAVRLLVSQCGNSEKMEDELAIRGLRAMGETKSLLRSVYYELRLKSDHPLTTHKPHKKSLICDALVDGKHLFSSAKESVALRDSLYTCSRRCPEKKRQFVVLQHCLAEKRFAALFDRLAITVEHINYYSDTDISSDDNSDSLSIVY
jgi:hypothetical protein